jgi:hypothetical protein
MTTKKTVVYQVVSLPVVMDFGRKCYSKTFRGRGSFQTAKKLAQARNTSSTEALWAYRITEGNSQIIYF